MIDGVPDKSGVYALYQGALCLYVGQAVNMRKRVYTHSRSINFDRVEFTEFEAKDLRTNEMKQIQDRRPALNLIRPTRISPPVKEEKRDLGPGHRKFVKYLLSLKEEHGSWAELARHLNVSHQCLYDCTNRRPSKVLLDALGMERFMRYEPIKGITGGSDERTV